MLCINANTNPVYRSTFTATAGSGVTLSVVMVV